MVNRKTTGKQKGRKRKKRIFGLALCKDHALKVKVARMGGLAPHTKPRGLLKLKSGNPELLRKIAHMGGKASQRLQAQRKKEKEQQKTATAASNQLIEIDKSQS